MNTKGSHAVTNRVAAPYATIQDVDVRQCCDAIFKKGIKNLTEALYRGRASAVTDATGGIGFESFIKYIMHSDKRRAAEGKEQLRTTTLAQTKSAVMWVSFNDGAPWTFEESGFVGSMLHARQATDTPKIPAAR